MPYPCMCFRIFSVTLNTSDILFQAKAEFVLPGGSVKDRVAKNMIIEAERTGKLKPGGTVCEGTAGSTGISLAMLSNALGFVDLSFHTMALPRTTSPY